MSSSAPRFTPLPVLERPSVPEFRRRLERARQPAVIRGTLGGWPALHSWSFESLRARVGGERILARASVPGRPMRFQGDPSLSFRYFDASVAEALDEMLSPRPDRRAHLVHVDLSRDLRVLGADVRKPDYCPRLFLSPPLLWVSGAGNVTPLHFDHNMTLIAQVLGKKRVVLVDHADSRRIARPVERWLWRTSGFDPTAPDALEYPMWRQARIFECTLEPGDLLFFPYRCWHYTSTDEPSVSVSFWWEPGAFLKIRDLAVGSVRRRAQRALRLAQGRPARPPTGR